MRWDWGWCDVVTAVGTVENEDTGEVESYEHICTALCTSVICTDLRQKEVVHHSIRIDRLFCSLDGTIKK